MPVSLQLAGSAHCLPPGRCVMAALLPPTPLPSALRDKGANYQLAEAGSGGTRLRVVGSCEAARVGTHRFSSAQLASP